MLRFRLIKIHLVCYFRDAMSIIVKFFFCSVSFLFLALLGHFQYVYY